MDQSQRIDPRAGAAIDTFDLSLPHGITLSCRGAGAADAPQRIVLLHGFPEAAFVWDDVIGAIGGATVRCIAPNLRGYERSSAPHGVEAYRAKHLVADLVALIGAIGAPIDVLVAHDWGGAVGWNLAALRPDLVKQLVVLNSPHPGTFLRELRDNPAQQAASGYMNWLRRPDAAERLADNDFARLFGMLDRFGRADWLTPALRERYRAVWSAGLEGALNYYRASPLRPPTADDRSIESLQLPDSVLNVTLPTRVLWGDADAALLPSLLQGLSHWVPKLSVRHVPDASHWIVHERPDLVIEVIGEALRDARTT